LKNIFQKFGAFYFKMPYKKYSKYKKRRKNSRLEYRKYRVRGNIRTFRDLTVYQQTTKLCSNIFDLQFPKKIKGKKSLDEELDILKKLSKQTPRLIAESWGDKFTNRQLAYSKLEQAMRYISKVITKLDFLIAKITGPFDSQNKSQQEEMQKIIRQYQYQRRKILNLKRSWMRYEKSRGKTKS